MSGGWQALIVTTLTAIIVGAIMESAKGKGRIDGPEVFTVKQAGSIKAVGIVCMLVFAAFMALAVFALSDGSDSLGPSEIPLVFGVFGFFFLLGAYVTVYAARWEIRVDNGRIEYTAVFGRTQVIQRKEIAYVTQTMGKLKAYDGWHHRIFTVDGPAKNRQALEGWLLRNHVPFDRDDSVAQNARIPGLRRRERFYLPKGARKKASSLRRANEARRQHYMTAPPSLPENLDELLRPFKKTSLQLLPGNPETPCVTGRSKFGGRPDLPPDFKWDYFEGEAPVFNGSTMEMVTKSRPLAFLLQINCQEVHALFPESPLPRRGLLSFFYELDTMLWGPESLDSIEYVKVHYFEDIDTLVPTPLPEDLKSDYHIPQHPVILGKEVNLPELDVFDRKREFESTLSNFKLYNETRLALGMSSTLHGEPGFGSRTLGWAASIQNDVFDDFAEVWLKGRVDPQLDIRRMEARADGGWELLLQLDSDVFEKMGAGAIMFGDAGSIYFGIRQDDLAAKRFEKTWFTMQCY